MGGLALGLLAALGWGIGDFYGGRASRRWPPLLIILGSMIIATLALIAVLLIRGTALQLSDDLAWSLLTGAVASLALLGFYHLLARGNMSIRAPLTALMATSLPVLFGILTTGLPGTAQIFGIATALVAIVLIASSRMEDREQSAPRTALFYLLEPILVGAIFGVCLIFLNQIRTTDVFGPLLMLRIAGISTLALALLLRPATRRPILALWQQKGAARETFAPGLKYMALIGLSDLGATGAYMLASQVSTLTIIAVLGSLYPAVTVLLARYLDRESLQRSQLLGLVCCLLAIALISFK
ncbi:MAG: EamA family transporter [Chloroflexi bacterium]|nr:EamA family transporter [Chloroflexota bacterium]